MDGRNRTFQYEPKISNMRWGSFEERTLKFIYAFFSFLFRPRINPIKHFSPTNGPNKLECFPLGGPFQLNLIFVNNPEPTKVKHTLDSRPFQFIVYQMESVGIDKHSSLFGPSDSDKDNSFITLIQRHNFTMFLLFHWRWSKIS